MSTKSLVGGRNEAAIECFLAFPALVAGHEQKGFPLGVERKGHAPNTAKRQTAAPSYWRASTLSACRLSGGRLPDRTSRSRAPGPIARSLPRRVVLQARTRIPALARRSTQP